MDQTTPTETNDVMIDLTATEQLTTVANPRRTRL